MKKLFLIKDSLTNQISYYHLLLLLASLPFDIFYSHIVLVSFAIHTVIQYKEQQIKKASIPTLLLLQSVFIVTLVSTLYTSNIKEAFNEWLKQVTIMTLPLICYFNTLDFKRYRRRLLHVFSIVCVLTIVYLFTDAVKTIWYYKLPYANLFSPAFTNHNFSDPIGIHATFFSMQIAVSFVFIITQLVKHPSVYYKSLYTISAIILSFGLLQLSSKSVFAVTLFIMAVAVPWLLLRKTKLFKYVAIVSSCCLVLIALICTSGTFRTRFVTELKYDFSISNKLPTSEPRIARWAVATELIAQSPVFGHGAGTEVGLLHNKFFAKKYYSSFVNHLNSHSQYLSFLIKSGVVGLVIYLATLWFGFKAAWRSKDVLFFTFMLLVATVSFSENLLDIDKGIFFYSAFFSFFIFSNAAEKLPELSEILVAEGNHVLV